MIDYRIESVRRILSRNIDPYFPPPQRIKSTRIWSRAGIKAWLRARETKPELGPEGWLKVYQDAAKETEYSLQVLETKVFQIDLSSARLSLRNADLPNKITVVLGGKNDRYDLYVTSDFDHSLRKLPRFANIPLDQPIGFDLEMLPIDSKLTRLT